MNASGQPGHPRTVGRPVPSLNVRTALAAVPDPSPLAKPGERVRATSTGGSDLLGLERSHGRLSEAAYRVGREVQRIGERAPGIRGSNWSGGDRVDVTRTHNEAVMTSVYHARQMFELEQHAPAGRRRRVFASSGRISATGQQSRGGDKDFIREPGQDRPRFSAEEKHRVINDGYEKSRVEGRDSALTALACAAMVGGRLLTHGWIQ